MTCPYEQRFCELLERHDLTPDEEAELTRLSRILDAADELDDAIREGFRELERTGRLERVH